MKLSVDGSKSAGTEGIVATAEHGAGVLVQGRMRSRVEVAQHGIRFPSAEEANGVSVDIGTK